MEEKEVEVMPTEKRARGLEPPHATRVVGNGYGASALVRPRNMCSCMPHIWHAAVWLSFGYSHPTAARFLIDTYLIELSLVIVNRRRFVGCDPLQKAVGCWGQLLSFCPLPDAQPGRVRSPSLEHD